ncbi:MAG: hypothetical protein KatS3mg068_1520 [Candidatus Sericytochromatia bacterium]|nr:MAG: hypothetical protein KatS3mg068_1520 [Candidatus Sericytochromatia bacterium]
MIIELKYNTAKIKSYVENGTMWFVHPLTGASYDEIEKVFQGWSEINEEYQKDWECLLKEYKKNYFIIDEFVQLLDKDENVGIDFTDGINVYKISNDEH